MANKIRVLIVDDEERFRNTTAAILSKRGFDVTAVGTGIEAIEKVKADSIDVVVLDVKMPGMDGNEALKEIKGLKPNLPVIMLTGHGTPESAIEGLKDGVFDYLTKPCSVELLANKIHEATSTGISLSEEEPRVRDIMVPLSSFSSISEDKTVREAIDEILRSFKSNMATTTIHENVHRSILVLGHKGDVIGIMTFTDLLLGLQPPYMRLMSERPNMADSIFIEAPSYSGLFTIMTRDLANKTVGEVMSEAPPMIGADATLMEAVNRMLTLGLKRLLVVENGKVIGVVREQDIFFEMEYILRHMRL